MGTPTVLSVLSIDGLNQAYSALKKAKNKCGNKKNSAYLELPAGKFEVSCKETEIAYKTIEELDKKDNGKIDQKFSTENYLKHVQPPPITRPPILIRIPYQSFLPSKKYTELVPEIAKLYQGKKVRWPNSNVVNGNTHLTSTVNEAIISGFIPQDFKITQQHFVQRFGNESPSNQFLFVLQPYELGAGYATLRFPDKNIVIITLAGFFEPFIRTTANLKQRSHYWNASLNHEKSHVLMSKYAQQTGVRAFFEIITKNDPIFTSYLDWLKQKVPGSVDQGRIDYFVEEACDFSFQQIYSPSWVNYQKQAIKENDLKWLSGKVKAFNKEGQGKRPPTSFSAKEKMGFFHLMFNIHRFEGMGLTAQIKKDVAAFKKGLSPDNLQIYTHLRKLLDSSYDFCKKNKELKQFILSQDPKFFDRIK